MASKKKVRKVTGPTMTIKGAPRMLVKSVVMNVKPKKGAGKKKK